jgi:hypothetical protein
MTIFPLLATSNWNPTIIKFSSVFRPDEHITASAGTMDIVAINELRLMRRSRS